MNENNSENNKNATYSGEGMFCGLLLGLVIGVIISAIRNFTIYLPIFTSSSMFLGMAIGSRFKKNNKSQQVDIKKNEKLQAVLIILGATAFAIGFALGTTLGLSRKNRETNVAKINYQEISDINYNS